MSDLRSAEEIERARRQGPNYEKNKKKAERKKLKKKVKK
jgi:hypothetical protein